MRLLALLLSGILLAATEPRVSIRMNPLVLMAGSAARVTCKVPRDERNRGVTIGIADYRSSYVQIDGLDGAITHQVLFEHIPCDAEEAYCDLEDKFHGHTQARQGFQVAGCGDGR